jgi:hypothetical protein
LLPCGPNDSYAAIAFGENDYHQPAIDHAGDDEARLAIGQIQIGHFDCKSVPEHALGGLKADSMLAQISVSLARISFGGMPISNW